MRPCPRCGRVLAEVRGAPDQACPWCGHVFPTGAPAAAPATVPAERVDPVAALGLAGRALRKRYHVMLLAWVPVVVAGFLAALVVGRAFPEDPALLTVEERLRFLGVAMPPALLEAVVEATAWALVAAAAFGDARATLRRPGALLGLGALLTLTYVGGFLLLVVPLFVFLHWFLYAPAALADGRTVGKAFDASRAFARARRTYGFTALVVLAYAAVALVSGYVTGPLLASALAGAGMDAVTAEALGGALASWPLAPLVPLLPAAYWRLAAAAPAPPEPRPAEAARERATVKCPRCATLVPYERGGGPADVTCPNCGARGRVPQ